ncbi:glycosyltransferase family 2 protein [candidate division KSB1 bacterium]|nr:glycosyltransferase family 2 protein [candidate division KSB1 bacterium]
MLQLLKYILAIPQFYFVFYTWLMFLSVIGVILFRVRYRKTEKPVQVYKRFAVMLPAYKANRQLIHVIEACISQDYPANKFDVFVLAQHCNEEIVSEARAKGAVVFEQTFDDCNGNPYLHALNYFVREIERYGTENRYDAIVLVDKDNLLTINFLAVINQRFQQGHRAVQGVRRPLNLDTNAACMDFVSEIMNDSMFRAAKASTGLSVEISGSGMAFDFELYKQAISSVDFQSPIHDKTFLIELIKRNVAIFFEPNAILFEEKTDSFQSIQNQRVRWIGGQIYLCRHNFFRLIRMGIQQLRLAPIDYAFTLSKIPRALHVAGLGFWILFALLLPQVSIISGFAWTLYLAGYFISILAFLMLSNTPRQVYRALITSPFFIFHIAVSTVKGMNKKINGRFIHTDHKKVVTLHDVNNES